MTAAAARQETFWQLVRYAVNGAIVTSVYTLVFVAFDSFTHAPLQLCNVAGFAVAACLGYVLHSRVTFRNHGGRDAGSILRFALASLPGFGINAFWTWLLGTDLRWPHWTVQLPIWFVTPVLIFAINRWWVFK